MLLQIILIFCSLLSGARSFIITVDAHETACFYEKAKKNDKITISFEVLEGGFHDIAVRLKDSDDGSLYESEKETKGRYTFLVNSGGDHKICFDNERSTLTPKVIMFQFTVIRSLKHYVNETQHQNTSVEMASLQGVINMVFARMTVIRSEQEYMHVRYKGRIDLGESVHLRIMIWSIVSPSLLLTMTLLEVYYLKRFFEVKRVV